MTTRLNSYCQAIFITLVAQLAIVEEVFALSSMDDQALASVSGEGIAFALQDFRMAMAGTSYIEQTGTTPNTITLPSGSTYTPDLANLRLYGLALSDGRPDASGGPDGTNGAAMPNGFGMFNFDGTPCSSTTGAGCPVAGAIPILASYDNPFLLRVFNYATNLNPDGSQSTALDYNGNAVNSPVLEFMAPTQMDSIRLASMIELAGNSAGQPLGTCALTGSGTTDSHCWLKAQFMVYDDTSNDQAGISTIPSGISGSFIRFIRSNGGGYSAGDVNTTGANGCTSSTTTPGAPNCDPTLGIIGLFHLTGDFRFSVNMSNASTYGSGSDGLDSTTLPIFSQREGLFMFGMNTYMPIGQMFYQSLNFRDDASHSGNFVIELTLLPNLSPVYSDFYGIDSTKIYQGYVDSSSYSVGSSYSRTHGYVRLGTNLWAPSSYTTGANEQTLPAGCTNIQGNAGCSSGTGNPPTCTSSSACTTNDGMVFYSSSTSSTFAAFSNRPDPNTNNWVNSINNTGGPPAPVANTNNGSFNVVNLGDSNIQGILLQHLYMKTCSAGPSGTNVC